MSDKEKYALFQGSVLLGYISSIENDFPWHFGTFEPTTAYSKVAHFFNNEIQLLNDPLKINDWEEAHKIITQLGITIKPLYGGKTIKKALIHIDGNKVQWR